jgi:hypothetical protein
MYPVLFQIGNFEIRSNGFIVDVSFLVVDRLSSKETERNGLEPQIIVRSPRRLGK